MPVVDSQTTDVGTEEGGGATEPDNDHNKPSARPKLTTAALKSSHKPAQSQGTSTTSNNSKQTVPTTTYLVAVSPVAVTAVDGQLLSHSACTSSPSEEHHSWVGSQPSSKPPSRQHSAGALSATSGKRKDSNSGNGINLFRKRRGSELSAKSHPELGEDDASYPSRPPSAAGSTGEGRFNLRDLLGAPKLSRKGSASSKKSEKSESGGKAGSTAGESNFSKKYGVCGKLAIGKGATSVVRLAHKWDRTEEKLYAVKEFRKRRKNESEKEYVKKLTSEFCISSTLHHPNVVETVDLVQDENHAWCEVMEFCAGGDLYAAIRKGGMSAAEVECCFKQLLTGLGYLHGQGVAHRDIKPENLFFNFRGQLKIGDFGASTVYRLPWESTIHKSSGLCGSEPYIAPEQFAHSSSYDARLVDVWACGIVYYCLHFQELPWGVAQPSDSLYSAYATQCASTQHSIANVPLPTAPTQPLSERMQQKEKEKEKATLYPTTIQNLSPRACRPILRRILEPNPEHRVLIEDILKNPWVISIELCTEPNVQPKHVHPCAVQTAQQLTR